MADGREVGDVYDRVTDDFMPLLSMPIVAGRGFSRRTTRPPQPVLINVMMARTIFGDANPIGQIIPRRLTPSARRARQTRRGSRSASSA